MNKLPNIRPINQRNNPGKTMAATSSHSYSSVAQFTGAKLSSDCNRYPPSRISFRQLRISANCAATAERISSAHVSTTPGSLYEVLGIQMGATCQEIKSAYRRLARVLHPDVAADQKENNVSEFIKVNEAYETLSDPEKRADYDRSLFWRGRQLSSSFITSAMASSSGFSRRRWETDQCW